MLSKICIALFLVSSSLVLATDESEYTFEFARFMVSNNKTYSKYEFNFRYNVFKKNYDLIKNHNAAGKSWKLAVNEFADLTFEEFRRQRLGLIPRRRHFFTESVNFADAANIPDSVDWRTKNAVTDVKNQGQCGSCWAFSTTGSVEGAIAIKTGKLVSLSEQQLVDCSQAEGNQGCNGGLMDDGFQYIINNQGICDESSYPYQAEDGTCQSCSPVARITKFVDVAPNNEAALKAAVALQPVSVAIEADQSGFQFYSSGIFDGDCGTQLDHGVLAVGYGTEDGKDYWIVKNSWGAQWGDEGYIRLARNAGSSQGQCGIAMEPSYPIAE